MVENGPRSASVTSSHSGTAAPAVSSAARQVTTVYATVRRRERADTDDTSISSRAPPTRTSIGAAAPQSTPGVSIGDGSTGSGCEPAAPATRAAITPLPPGSRRSAPEVAVVVHVLDQAVDRRLHPLQHGLRVDAEEHDQRHQRGHHQPLLPGDLREGAVLVVGVRNTRW